MRQYHVEELCGMMIPSLPQSSETNSACGILLLQRRRMIGSMRQCALRLSNTPARACIPVSWACPHQRRFNEPGPKRVARFDKRAFGRKAARVMATSRWDASPAEVADMSTAGRHAV